MSLEDTAALNVGRHVKNAMLVTNRDDILRGIKSVHVTVFVVGELEKLVSRDRIKTRFELRLRSSGVPIMDSGDVLLDLIVKGQKMAAADEVVPYFIFGSELRLMEPVMVSRPGQVMLCKGTVWERGAAGIFPAGSATEMTLDKVDAMAEDFANAYLAANQTAPGNRPGPRHADK